MLTPQMLYEQFIEETTKIGCALTWEELPEHVREAWANVLRRCKIYCASAHRQKTDPQNKSFRY